MRRLTFLSYRSHVVKFLMSVYISPKYHTSLRPSVRVTSSKSCFPVALAYEETKGLKITPIAVEARATTPASGADGARRITSMSNSRTASTVTTCTFSCLGILRTVIFFLSSIGGRRDHAQTWSGSAPPRPRGVSVLESLKKEERR